MNLPTETNQRRELRRWIAPALGYLVSLVCLVWVYRGFDWHQEFTRLSSLLARVAVAVGADVFV
jgi:hypothetical protein